MVECPTCSDEFSQLGTHFYWREGHRPSLGAEQRAVLDFLALRGFETRENTAHPSIETYSTSREFLEEVAEGLGWLANPIRLHSSGADSAERMNERHGTDYDDDSFSDVWAFSTVPHPELGDYEGPTSVERLRPLTARLLVMTTGRWVGGPIGTLQLDVRGFEVSGDHLQRLLRDMGVSSFCHDSKAGATLAERGHWHDDVVAVPHFEAMALLQRIGMDVGEAVSRLSPQLIRGTG